MAFHRFSRTQGKKSLCYRKVHISDCDWRAVLGAWWPMCLCRSYVWETVLHPKDESLLGSDRSCLWSAISDGATEKRQVTIWQVVKSKLPGSQYDRSLFQQAMRVWYIIRTTQDASFITWRVVVVEGKLALIRCGLYFILIPGPYGWISFGIFDGYVIGDGVSR